MILSLIPLPHALEYRQLTFSQNGAKTAGANVPVRRARIRKLEAHINVNYKNAFAHNLYT